MSLRNFGIGRSGCLAFIAVLSAVALPLAAKAEASPSNPVESQPTAAGAIATDEHWSLAEMMGDTAFLDQLLLPDYRSVNNDGTAHSKAQIVAGAAKRSGTDLASANRTLAAYRKTHPYGTSAVLRGNLAILSFYDPALGPQKGVESSDVLVYAQGHWHAIYSQHTGYGHGG